MALKFCGIRWVRPELAAAAALCLFGMPAYADNDWHIGWVGGISEPRIKDPDGPIQSRSEPLVEDLLVMYDLSRDTRILVQGTAQNYTLDASTTDIGQKVSRLGLIASYQLRLRLSDVFKPYFGAGLGYESESYKNRYTVTDTGFLQQQYSGRKENSASIAVNATTQWNFLFGTQAGFHLQYEYGLGRLSNLATVGVIISY
jgi:hypothetical protein